MAINKRFASEEYVSETIETVKTEIQTDIEQLSEEIVDLKNQTPTAPVTSVNGKTGNVVLGAEDVGATTKAYVDAEITDLEARVGQQHLLFAEGDTVDEALEWLDTNGDASKVYVLPDGFFYEKKETIVETDGVAYTNQIPLSTDADRKTIFGVDYNGDGIKDGYQMGMRLSSSGSTSTSGTNIATSGTTGFIPAKVGDVLRIKNFDKGTGTATYIISYNSSNTKVGVITNPAEVAGSSYVAPGYYEVTLTEALLGSGFDAIRFCINGFKEDTICTINEEIKEGGGTAIVEQWLSTGQAFVPTDYDDSIANLVNITDAHTAEIKKLKESGVSTQATTMYISPDGDDNNDGLTVDTPKKTVTACVSAGATKVSAKRGVYKEKLYFTDIEELEIFPTDNDQTYSTTEKWNPIIFEQVDDIAPSNLVAYNSIKRIAYSNSANEQLDKVFVAQSQPAIIGDGYGSRYNSTIWLLSSDEKTVCIKLKPVLTVAECEAETNTFTYVSGYIYINASMTNVARIVVPTNWGNCITFKGAKRIVLREVEAKFGGAYNMDIRNCSSFDLYKCACKYTSYASGFHPVNANGVFNNCYATKNYDGFGISGYGHQTFIDCISEFNFDDGVSHHDGSKGTFIGGRYEGNGKGGNTPAYGAEVNIYGGLFKDNASFGIGYLYTSAHNPSNGMVQGAVMVGNPIGLKVDANCNVTVMNCKYVDNTTDKTLNGNVTEY